MEYVCPEKVGKGTQVPDAGVSDRVGGVPVAPAGCPVGEWLPPVRLISTNGHAAGTTGTQLNVPELVLKSLDTCAAHIERAAFMSIHALTPDLLGQFVVA